MSSCSNCPRSGLDETSGPTEVAADDDVASERTFDQLGDVLDEVVEIEHLGFHRIGFPEHEKLAGHVGGLLGRALNAREVVGDGAGVVEVPRRDTRVVEDDADQVVEVVRDAGRQPTEALEPAGLVELGFEAVAGELGLLLMLVELRGAEARFRRFGGRSRR